MNEREEGEEGQGGREKKKQRNNHNLTPPFPTLTPSPLQ